MKDSSIVEAQVLQINIFFLGGDYYLSFLFWDGVGVDLFFAVCFFCIVSCFFAFHYFLKHFSFSFFVFFSCFFAFLCISLRLSL